MNKDQKKKLSQKLEKSLESIKSSAKKMDGLKRSIFTNTKKIGGKIGGKISDKMPDKKVHSGDFNNEGEDQPAKGEKSEQLIASLDVGTEYIKALIAKIDGEDIEVIGVAKQPQRLTDMHAGAIADIGGVVESCDEALAKAEEMAGVGVDSAVLGIAGELVRGITYTVTYKRREPEEQITAEEMQLVIEKAQEQSKTRAAKQLAQENGEDDIDVKLINSAIVAMFVDGYKISNPIGFQGSKLSIRLYSAFAPMVHIGAISQVADQLSLDLTAVAAEPFAVSRTIVGTDPASSVSAILIDVGGGTTDLAFVEEGGVQGTRSFGIGGRSFTKAVATELGVSFKDAERLKTNLTSDDFSVAQRAKAQKALERTVDVWISGVELSIAEFVEEQGERYGNLPGVIMLCGGGSSLEMLPKALNNSDSNKWLDDLPFAHKPRVGLIKAEAAKGIVDKTGKIRDHTFVTALGLLRVGQDTIGGEEQEGKIRSSLKKVLRN